MKETGHKIIGQLVHIRMPILQLHLTGGTTDRIWERVCLDVLMRVAIHSTVIETIK